MRVLIHCMKPGFRRYGHQFTKPTTLVEVTGDGKVPSGSPAECAITPAQLDDLKRWVKRPGNERLLGYSDPNAESEAAAAAEAKLREAHRALAALDQQKREAQAALERANAERVALEAERESVAKELAEMQAQLDDREKAARALEARIVEQQQLLDEMSADKPRKRTK